MSVSWYVLIEMYVLEPLQIIYDTRRQFSHVKKQKKNKSVCQGYLYTFDLTVCSMPLRAAG